jgi:hypothetical protein
MGTRCTSRVLSIALLVLVAASGTAQTGNDTPQSAIERIRSGQYTPLPPLTSSPASRDTGRGLDIENRSGGTLLVYFSGAVDRTVTVQDGQSIGAGTKNRD